MKKKRVKIWREIKKKWFYTITVSYWATDADCSDLLSGSGFGNVIFFMHKWAGVRKYCLKYIWKYRN